MVRQCQDAGRVKRVGDRRHDAPVRVAKQGAAPSHEVVDELMPLTSVRRQPRGPWQNSGRWHRWCSRTSRRTEASSARGFRAPDFSSRAVSVLVGYSTTSNTPNGITGSRRGVLTPSSVIRTLSSWGPTASVTRNTPQRVTRVPGATVCGSSNGMSGLPSRSSETV